MLERMEHIELHRKPLKSKKWIIALVTVIFIMCGSTMALAATDHMVDIYSAVVEHTSSMVAEELDAEEVLIEHREYVGPEFYADLTAVTGEITPNAAPTATISADLVDYWSSGQFSASSGQEIVVNVSMDPSNVNIKVGIAEPDGWLRYVYNCGTINHTFKLDKTGNYVVFMRNETDRTVNVLGSYRTRTPN